MGLRRKGNITIRRILQSPVYADKQYVAPYKDYPRSLFNDQYKEIINLI